MAHLAYRLNVDMRPWRPDDREVIVPMIADCLAVNAKAGADIAPTDANANVLWAQGCAWAAAGDPTLAWIDDGQPVAWTLWGGMETVGGLQMVDRICYGLSTYVRPEFRRDGIASQLRRAALAQAKAAGYAKVVGVAFHEAGLRSSLHVGFSAVGTQVECRL